MNQAAELRGRKEPVLPGDRGAVPGFEGLIWALPHVFVGDQANTVE